MSCLINSPKLLRAGFSHGQPFAIESCKYSTTVSRSSRNSRFAACFGSKGGATDNVTQSIRPLRLITPDDYVPPYPYRIRYDAAAAGKKEAFIQWDSDLEVVEMCRKGTCDCHLGRVSIR